jgi:hypothetical protein
MLGQPRAPALETPGGLVRAMEKDPKTYNVRAVERAMQILSSFDGERAERGVSEIAQATGLHKATAHRITMTLLNGGFLERTPDRERFRLGLRVVELGMGALRDLDFRQAAFPYMQQLVERFQETCDLGILDRGRVLYVGEPVGCKAQGSFQLFLLQQPLFHLLRNRFHVTPKDTSSGTDQTTRWLFIVFQPLIAEVAHQRYFPLLIELHGPKRAGLNTCLTADA